MVININMDDCSLCDESAVYICTSCNILLCKDHRDIHESRKKEHKTKQLSVNLNPEKLSKIVEKLFLKIKAIGECEERIVQETAALLKKIQSMRLYALNIVREKRKKYIRLLKISQERLLVKQMREISFQVKTNIEEKVSESNEIEEFYKLAFLKESNIIQLEEIKDPILDLSMLLLTDLLSDKVKRLNPRACSVNIGLEVGEIISLIDQAQDGDPDLLVYLGALLLVKLDRGAPQGNKIIPSLYKACRIIHNLRPQLIPSMSLHVSSIVSTEVSKAEDDISVIDWLETANYAMQLEGATQAPRSAINLRLAAMFEPRIRRICRETPEECVLETLDYLLKARKYGFMLDDKK